MTSPTPPHPFGLLGLVPTEGATGGGRKEWASVGMSLHRRHGGQLLNMALN